MGAALGVGGAGGGRSRRPNPLCLCTHAPVKQAGQLGQHLLGVLPIVRGPGVNLLCTPQHTQGEGCARLVIRRIILRAFLTLAADERAALYTGHIACRGARKEAVRPLLLVALDKGARLLKEGHGEVDVRLYLKRPALFTHMDKVVDERFVFFLGSSHEIHAIGLA